MAGYRISRAADRKLSAIYEYSLLNFGEVQADRYFSELLECFELLASQPTMGRAFGGFRRHEHGRYVIFYKPENGNILIVEVLHQSEDIETKLF